MLFLGQILSKHHIFFHCFADDIQLYIPFELDEQSALEPLLGCLVDISSWMGANSLKLNEAKTEVVVFRKSSQVFLTDALSPLSANIRPKARGDRLWNALPFHICAAQSLVAFKSLLKTHLFSSAFEELFPVAS